MVKNSDVEVRAFTQWIAQLQYGPTIGEVWLCEFDPDVEAYLFSVNALALVGDVADPIAVTSLDLPTWEPSNPSVVMGADGVVYGPYADGSNGGSVRYHGLDGQPMSAVQTLIFTMTYDSDPPTPTPYLRVFTQDTQAVAHDAIYSATAGMPGESNTWDATAGLWRYDDDADEGGEFGDGAPFADVLATHGTELIQKITITVGFTPCANLSGLLTVWRINDDRFVFGT
jgi:hypothetical protein